MADSSFNTQLDQKARFVNNTVGDLIALLWSPYGQQGRVEHNLKEAIRYTLQAGGKRIRSALVLFCCELISGRVNHNAEIAAAAIEMVHTYSLVHDDLPAMDDDDLRRGRPACHKAFDEATAILTGDALLTLAFEVLAKEIDEPAIAVRLIGQLAKAAGPEGMIAGQMADMKFTIDDCRLTIENQKSKIRNRKSEIENQLKYIHINKTAKMFRCAAVCGAICGRADESQISTLGEYGLKIGLGFQIADDILDVSGSSEHLGKTAGKDEKADKLTYPKVLGLEKSRQLAEKLADEAIMALQPFGEKADTLRQLAMALLERTK